MKLQTQILSGNLQLHNDCLGKLVWYFVTPCSEQNNCWVVTAIFGFLHGAFAMMCILGKVCCSSAAGHAKYCTTWAKNTSSLLVPMKQRSKRKRKLPSTAQLTLFDQYCGICPLDYSPVMPRTTSPNFLWLAFHVLKSTFEFLNADLDLCCAFSDPVCRTWQNCMQAGLYTNFTHYFEVQLSKNVLGLPEPWCDHYTFWNYFWEVDRTCGQWRKVLKKFCDHTIAPSLHCFTIESYTRKPP